LILHLSGMFRISAKLPRRKLSLPEPSTVLILLQVRLAKSGLHWITQKALRELKKLDCYVQYHVIPYMHNNTYIIISQIYITNAIRYAYRVDSWCVVCRLRVQSYKMLMNVISQIRNLHALDFEW
jgi:hypothetical protein